MNPLPPRNPTRHTEDIRLPDELRPRLEALLDAVEFLSPTAFRFAGGQPIDCAVRTTPPAGVPWTLQGGLSLAGLLQPLGLQGGLASIPTASAPAVAPAPAPAPTGTPSPVVDALWPLFYFQAYTRRFAGTAHPMPTGASPELQPDPAFIARLSAANRSRLAWDPLWMVYQLGPSGLVHVRKGDTFRVAVPGEYAFEGGPGRMPRVGDTVALLVHREGPTLQLGFYYVFGETISSEFDDAHLARVYFHLRPEGAPWLVELVSRDLNRYRVPFRMKCLSNPAAYMRTDSGVLYVARRFLPITLRLLAASREEFARYLHPDVPLFTRWMAPGLGVADDPGSAESFGQSRCRLTAQALLDAYQQGKQDRMSRLQALADRFAALGLSLERPYLAEGLDDPFHWPSGQEAAA